MKHFFRVVMALLPAGCQQKWGNVENWYDSAALPDEDLVDVFYICSTEVMESRREDGSVSPTALLTDDERYALHRGRFQPGRDALRRNALHRSYAY